MTIIALVKKYGLIVLGGIIFLMYFWNRFIRERTSKFLPLYLNTLGLISLIYICIIFLYITISLLKTRSKNVIIEQLVELLFTPIIAFDDYLKSFTVIKNYYQKLVISSLSLLEFLIIKTDLFFIIFWLFPRFVMLTALFMDVFVFHQLHYKYLVILFGILLFLNRYFRYSLKSFKNTMLNELSLFIDDIITDYYSGINPSDWIEDYDPNDGDYDEGPQMSIPFHIFVKFQTESIVYRNIANKIYFINFNVTCSRDLHVKYPNLAYINHDGYAYQVYNSDNDKGDLTLLAQIWRLIKLAVILETYSLIDNNPYIKWIKVLIFFNYFLCWLYVLIVSLKTLDVNAFNVMLENTWVNISDPFSYINL